MQRHHRSIHVHRPFYEAIVTLALLLPSWPAFNLFTPR